MTSVLNETQAKGGCEMTGKTENEIILLGWAAAKELHEIISAAKELGIKLTNRSGYGEFVERYNADPVKLCVDDGRTDESFWRRRRRFL
jgi:LAS superfamily LD-carboxypeptidase LdcB